MRTVPRARNGKCAEWMLLVLSTGTLLTNAYYLCFAKPAVSLKTLAAALHECSLQKSSIARARCSQL